MPQCPESIQKPWHAHLVIYFHNRINKSLTNWRIICHEFINMLTTSSIALHVEWLKTRNGAYKYIAKEGAQVITFPREHPLYFDASKLINS